MAGHCHYRLIIINDILREFSASMEGRGLLKSLFGLLALSVIFVSGCATSTTREEARQDGGAVGQVLRDSDPATGSKPAAVVVNQTSATSSLPLQVRGQVLKNTRFDYPVRVNPAVEYWVAYFTGKGRKHFDRYLQRSRYFIPEISKILKQHNMPQDLVYLAMIESGFNNSAKSRARAVGPWQFIRPTGVRYGMTVDFWLDERRDTRKSTLAAIAYLKELYEEFGSWELASAGYNAGENKVRRAIKKYRVNDFWEISRHRFFKRETRDYVPKIMAAAILTKNAELFGFANPFTGETPNPTILLASASDEDAAEIEEEPTPKELGEPAPKSEDTTEDVAEKAEETPQDVAAADDEAEDEDESEIHAVLSQSPMAAISPSVYMVANPNEQILEFEIKGPADLFAISKASGLPYSTLKLLNPELLRWCTPPTMKSYRVKLPKSSKDRFLATYNDESFDRRVVFMKYKVLKSDTIDRIARRFGTEVPPIKELNGMKSNNLRVGSSIALPVPTGYKRVIASMYDDKPVYGKGGKKKRSRRRQIRRKSRGGEASVQHYRLKPSFSPENG